MIPLPPQEMPATALAPGGLMGAIARRQPVGAVACITPYNFPIVNMAGKLGPALAMGNTVVVRPASQNPLAVIELVRIMHEVGFPPGVVNVVTGSTPDTGEALVETPRHRHGVVHRFDRRRHAHRRGRRPHDEAHAARARRQGRARSCSTTPTSRPRSR